MKQYNLFRIPDGQDTGTTTAPATMESSSDSTSNSDNSGDSNTSDSNSGQSTSDDTSSSTSDTSTTLGGGNSTATDSEGFRVLDSGSWNGSVTKNYRGGQVMHFQLKNVNILGTTITISSNLGGKKSLIILPQQTSDMRFDCFGAEPMGWTFDISTDSDAFIVTWSLFSSWLPGDPFNG
jgi:hypothetical protein